MYEYRPRYISPRGPGRPPQRVDKELTVSQFWMGPNVYFDSTRIEGECRLAFNNRCLEGSTLDRRPGFQLEGPQGDAGRVYCQMVLQQVNAPDIHLRIIDGAGAGVQVQKKSGSSWVNIGNNIGTAHDRVDWDWTYIQISGEDRVYFTNGVSNLHYTQGSAITEVSGIKGRYIDSKEGILVMGHMTEVYHNNTFVWSKGGSHQFYLDGEDYATSSNAAWVDGPITGIKCFNWVVYTFTAEDGLFETDITGLPAPRKVSDHGTLSPKSIACGFDTMYWADQYGVWQLPLGGNVTKISKGIENFYRGLSFINFYQLVGGVNTKEQYELHLGNVNFEGVTHNKVVLVYEIEQSRHHQYHVWRIDKDKIFANNIVSMADEYGFFSTYYGSRDSQSVFITDVGNYDGDIANEIEIDWISKDFPLVSENFEYTAGDIYIRYTPLGSDDLPISLYLRKDTEPWQLVGHVNLPPGSGQIALKRIQGIKGLTGRTLGIRIVSGGLLPFSIKQLTVNYSFNDSQLKPLVPISI